MNQTPTDLTAALRALFAERATSGGSHPEAEDLVAYHDGELAPEREEEIQDHIVSCSACADLLLELARIDTLEAADAAADAVAGEETAPATVLELPSPGSPERLRREAGKARPAARRWLWAAGVGLAAALALVVVLPRGSYPPLESYALTVGGARAETRGEPGGSGTAELYRFAPGRPLEVLLRPARPVEGPLEAIAYLGIESPRVWRVPFEISPQGAVRIAGAIGTEIDLPEGRSELLLAVGRPKSLPAASELAQRLGTGRQATGAGWAGWRITVSVEAADRTP